MDALDHFSIPLSGLRDGLHHYVFEIRKDFFDQFPGSLLSDGRVEVQLDFDKRPDMCTMVFTFLGEVEVTCDRCLDPFFFPVSDKQSLLVKYAEEEGEDADVIYILKGAQILNVAKYIYDFINLAVPMIRKHEDAGKRCNPDMLKYLSEQEEAEEEGPSNPFLDALKGLNFESES